MLQKIKTFIVIIISISLSTATELKLGFPIAPALFGIGILAANHNYTAFKVKILSYILIMPLFMIVFILGGMLMSWVGLVTTSFINEGISVYIGSGLCAVIVGFIFSKMLKNFKLTVLNSVILFGLGAIALLLFFIWVNHPLDKLYRGLNMEKDLYLLHIIWQLLVGLGITNLIIEKENLKSLDGGQLPLFNEI